MATIHKTIILILQFLSTDELFIIECNCLVFLSNFLNLIYIERILLYFSN